MDAPIIVAITSAATALAVAVATYAFSRRRDREADWRKARLEHYREFIAALSGITGRRALAADQVRYSNAVNSLTLVAPASVLRVLYDFQDEIGPRNLNKSPDSHDAAIANLLRELRCDIHPAAPDDHALQFRLFDAPEVRAENSTVSVAPPDQ